MGNRELYTYLPTRYLACFYTVLLHCVYDVFVCTNRVLTTMCTIVVAMSHWQW